MLTVILAQALPESENLKAFADINPILDDMPVTLAGLHGLMLYFTLRYGGEAKRLEGHIPLPTLGSGDEED
ncbi:MAG: hypothetical protein WA952_06360 [Lewinella sp.]